MKIALLCRNKLGFVDGTCTLEQQQDPDLRHIWDRCNAVVLSWLLHSVDKSISDGIAFSDSAEHVWTELKERFDKSDNTHIFGLHSVSSCHSRVKGLWDEIDSLILPGMESRVEQVWSLLNEQPHRDGASMLGIWGMGGVGKTTLARVIYYLLESQFEHLCFLYNVRDKPIHDLQKKLLSKITGDEDTGLKQDTSRTPIILKERLRKKKVLLILDDVCSTLQLKALAGYPDWFGAGSIIIITTRDKSLMTRHGIDRMYEVPELNAVEARKLLVWNAFRSKEIGPEYEDVIHRAVDYAGGLPEALEVLGSNLCGRTVHEWESILDLYEAFPANIAKFLLLPKFLPAWLSFEWSYLHSLNLVRCNNLTALPDLSGAPELRELSVAYCNNLMKVDSRAGHHANLRSLRARGCTKLISFLEDGINFSSLQILDLTGCSNFRKFPEI